jgi:hypothetical protein
MMIRTITATALTAGLVLTAAPSAEAMRRCPTEDSKNCVWDAKHMGNGEGRSYWVGSRGKVHYTTHRHAHRMMLRG